MKIEIAGLNNSFTEYLRSFMWFNSERLMKVMKEYVIGTTEQGEPIFWHINDEHQVTNGHIITMDGKTGKVYDSSWYYHDKQSMCLFGEHLLKVFLSKPVALVKAEMTAAIMSSFPTPYVWLATGRDITASDLTSLTDRTVILFPDKGEYNQCMEVAFSVSNTQLHVSDVMEKAHVDFQNIAQMTLSQQPLCPTPEVAALMRVEETNPNISQLIATLSLQVMSVSSDNEEEVKGAQNTTPSISSQRYDSQNIIRQSQKERWQGRNPECHQCEFSHESINGTYCRKCKCYVEYGKGDCCR